MLGFSFSPPAITKIWPNHRQKPLECSWNTWFLSSSCHTTGLIYVLAYRVAVASKCLASSTCNTRYTLEPFRSAITNRCLSDPFLSCSCKVHIDFLYDGWKWLKWVSQYSYLNPQITSKNQIDCMVPGLLASCLDFTHTQMHFCL